jgi:hypothetical protein
MVDLEASLWLLSQAWFEFFRCQFETLVEHHMHLYQQNPTASNYGVMTGLFTYLMQSVLFTPTMVNLYVRVFGTLELQSNRGQIWNVSPT